VHACIPALKALLRLKQEITSLRPVWATSETLLEGRKGGREGKERRGGLGRKRGRKFPFIAISK
jgi:hypothetical protein